MEGLASSPARKGWRRRVCGLIRQKHPLRRRLLIRDAVPNRGGGARTRRGGNETRPHQPTSATRRQSSRCDRLPLSRLPDAGRSSLDPDAKGEKAMGSGVCWGGAPGGGGGGWSCGSLRAVELIRGLPALTRTLRILTFGAYHLGSITGPAYHLGSINGPNYYHDQRVRNRCPTPYGCVCLYLFDQ